MKPRLYSNRDIVLLQIIDVWRECLRAQKLEAQHVYDTGARLIPVCFMVCRTFKEQFDRDGYFFTCSDPTTTGGLDFLGSEEIKSIIRHLARNDVIEDVSAFAFNHHLTHVGRDLMERAKAGRENVSTDALPDISNPELVLATRGIVSKLVALEPGEFFLRVRNEAVRAFFDSRSQARVNATFDVYYDSLLKVADDLPRQRTKEFY